MNKVFQLVVQFADGNPNPIEAVVIADNRNDALLAASARLTEDNAPDHAIECSEMTPDYLETMYLSATDPDSPFTKAGISVDLSTISDRVLDVLCPQCEDGEIIRAYVEASRTPERANE